MEKKTIGKFISVLRRANGMTQKELGDRLYVSDKTVSRWERDECTPELALLPALADLFGVTIDELIRGERAAPAAPPLRADETPPRSAAGRPFRILLRRHTTGHRLFTLLSAAVGLLGLIGAAICNLGFSRGLLGFCIALIFILAAVCLLLVFTNLLYLRPDEEDDALLDALHRANHRMVLAAVRGLTFQAVLLGFILPIAVYPPDAHWGLEFGAWLVYGALYAGAAWLICHLLYVLVLQQRLTEAGLLHPEVQEIALTTRRKSLLKRVALVLLISELVLGGCMLAENLLGPKLFMETRTFTTYEEFTDFMYQGSYELWYEDYIGSQIGSAKRTAARFGSGDSADVDITETPIFPDEEQTEDADEMLAFYTCTVEDANGRVLCQYINYRSFAALVDFSFDTSPDGLPVTVTTNDAYHRAWSIHNDILSVLSALMLLDVVACAAAYLLLDRKKAR